MKITVIGAGNGGHAMAGHFALLGHKVTLYNRSQAPLLAIKESGGVSLSGAINGFGVLHKLTNNLSEAIKDSELIMVTTIADAHRELAQKISPFVENNQIFILNPGRTLGALEFFKNLKTSRGKKFFIAEAQSLIYACRTETYSKVKVIGVKDKVLLAALPARDTDKVLNAVNSVYNCFIGASNVLVTSLENIGAILHPAVVLLNVAAIERGQEFFFYNDMTPTVANLVLELDKERLKIGESFGVKLRSVSDWVSFAYKNVEGDSFLEKIRNNPAYFQIKSPARLNTRFLTEDIPTGILPMIELGKINNLELPLMHSVYHLAKKILDVDFEESGRTLKNLGLQNLSKSAFLKELI